MICNNEGDIFLSRDNNKPDNHLTSLSADRPDQLGGYKSSTCTSTIVIQYNHHLPTSPHMKYCTLLSVLGSCHYVTLSNQPDTALHWYLLRKKLHTNFLRFNIQQ